MTSNAHVSHIPQVRTLVFVWLALMLATALTTAVSYVELGWMNIVIALLIAVCKASLVVWIFMGVRFTTNLTKLFVVAGLVWLAILILLTASDYNTRHWTYQAQPWSHAAGNGPATK